MRKRTGTMCRVQVLMRKGLKPLIVTTGILGIGLLPVFAWSEPPSEFYRGKKITIIVGGAPGIASDLVPRVMAPLIEMKTGAKVTVENRPAAGGQEAINYVYAKGSKEGLTLLSRDPGTMLLNQLLGAPGTHYDVARFNYLISLMPTNYVFAVPGNSPYKSLQDLQRGKGLKFASASAGGQYVACCVTLIDAAKLAAKVVTGLKGAGEITLALEKNEANGGIIPGYYAKRQGEKLRVLFTMYEKSPVLPDVPRLPDLMKLPPAHETVLKTWANVYTMLAAPPNVPQDRIEFLRRVLVESVKDRDMQKAITDVLKFPTFTGYTKGEQLQEYMRVDRKELKEAIEQLKVWLEKFSA